MGNLRVEQTFVGRSPQIPRLCPIRNRGSEEHTPQNPSALAVGEVNGMAARRIREVTGFPYCYTIHSLLEFSHGRFQRDFSNPLDQTVVILDEASMVNVDLFYSLLSALRRDILLVLVGDPAQLPPIGPETSSPT